MTMHRTPRSILLLSTVVSLAAAQALAQRDELGRGQTETEQFHRLYPSRAKTFIKASSDPDDLPTAPSRGNDDGFTGLNGCEAYRTQLFGQPTSVLADIEGRSGFIGCIFRNYWSGYLGDPIYAPQELNRAIARADGTSVVDRELSSFFRNEGSGQLAPFTGPFTGNRAGAYLTHTPIPFDDTFQLLVFENAFDNSGRFHKVCGTLDPPESRVRIPDLIEWEEVARKRLWMPSASQPSRIERWPHAVPPAWQSSSLSIPAAGAASVSLAGPRTILGLECTVGNAINWNDLWAVFTFDGAATPDVEVPLRMLGNMSRRPFSAPMSGLLFGNDGSRTVTSFFPMPFLQSADLRIENRGTAPAQVTVQVSSERGRPQAPWGYFTAMWQRGLTQTGVPFQGPSLPGRRGMLRHIALESWMEMGSRIPNQTQEHLEGDLCVRINGNRGDDHTFAASETSIGKWGWYLTPSDVPFVRDSSFHTGIFIAPVGGVMQTNRIQGSTFVFDPIQFVDGIEIVLEHGPQNQANAEYGLFTVFYLERGGPAREEVMELDVGDAVAEAAANVSFTEFGNYSLTSEFFRDPFFGTAPVQDTVREVDVSYAFDVQVPNPSLYPTGYAIGVRLDRQRATGVTTRAQAEVYVDGQFAGLVHAWTSNPTFRWKEGGELEVELPRALTAGKTQFRVELRPRANTDPFRLARAWVYGYTRN